MLQPPIIWLQRSGKHHLDGGNERHSSIVASRMRIAVLKPAQTHEVPEANLLAQSEAALASQHLGVNHADHGPERIGVKPQRRAQQVHVAMQRMAHDNYGAEAQLRLLRVNRPGKHLLQHAAGLLLFQEARLPEAIRVGVADAELDVEQVCMLLDARVVKVHLLEQMFAMQAWRGEGAHVARVKGRYANLGDGRVVAGPALGVEADEDCIVC